MAADEATDFAFLTAAARRSIGDLRAALKRVPRAPDERGSHYLAVIEATLQALDDAVDTREVEFKAAKDAVDRRAVVLATREINHYVMSFHGVTPDIESAAEPALALGFIYFVDQLVMQLFNKKADVVMMPGLKYNYSTGYRPFEDALEDLGVTAYPVKVPPVVVRYPVQEADSLFLHLVVAHELGHHVIDQAKLDEEVLQQDPASATNAASFQVAIDEYRNLHKVSEARARALVVQSFIGWLHELICDGIGFGLLGPSYLLAYGAFSTPFGGPEPSASHPPFTLRTRFLTRLVDAWGWRDLLEAEVPTTFGWIEETGKRAQEAGSMIYFLQQEEIADRLAETIKNVIDTKLGDQRYTPADYDKQKAQLSGLLENNVLPAQLSDRSAPDRRSIILAGWLQAFKKHGDEPTAFVRMVADGDYQRFLTKALEMSTVLDEWGKL